MSARVEGIATILSVLYPSSNSELVMDSPLEILVAVILSAQCRDAQVNKVTPGLFAKYRSIEDYISIPIDELQRDISSIGLYKKKATAIQGACVLIKNKHNGQVPLTFDALKELPGVGSKVANVVLSQLGLPAGFVVDTHVKRVAYRLGLTAHTNPDKVEADLETLFLRDQWSEISGRLILHGRRVCQARKPDCKGCMLLGLCPRQGLTPS